MASLVLEPHLKPRFSRLPNTAFDISTTDEAVAVPTRNRARFLPALVHGVLADVCGPVPRMRELPCERQVGVRFPTHWHIPIVQSKVLRAVGVFSKQACAKWLLLACVSTRK